jgi:WD40 repeat protein
VADRVSGNVVLVDLGSLAITQLVAPGTGGLSDPKGLAWSGNTLLVSSGTANAVFYFDLAGQSTGVRAEGLNSSLDAGIHFSPDGERVFVTSISGNDVVEFDAASGARVRLFNNVCPNLPLPFDSVLGADGRLYISCTLNSSIERFDATTGTGLGSFVIAGGGGLTSPRSLTFGPNGNLFVANGSGAIFEFNGTNGQPANPVTFVDANANGGGPLDAFGMQFRGGVLYATSNLTDEVMAFEADTGAFLSIFVTAGCGGISGPTALDFGPDGDLKVSSQSDEAIRRYDGATGAFVSVFVPTGTGGLDSPFDLAFRPTHAVPAVSRSGRALLCALLIASFIRSARRSRRTGE